MAKLLLLAAALFLPAALLCGDQEDAGGQCGASREPSLAGLVEDLHGENVLSRLLPEDGGTSTHKQVTNDPGKTSDAEVTDNSETKVRHSLVNQQRPDTVKTSETSGVKRDVTDKSDIKVQDKTRPSLVNQLRPNTAKTSEASGTKRDATDNAAGSKVQDKTRPSLVNQLKTNPGKPSDATGVKRDATDNAAGSKVQDKIRPSIVNQLKTNPGKPPEAAGVKRDAADNAAGSKVQGKIGPQFAKQVTENTEKPLTVATDSAGSKVQGETGPSLVKQVTETREKRLRGDDTAKKTDNAGDKTRPSLVKQMTKIPEKHVAVAGETRGDVTTVKMADETRNKVGDKTPPSFSKVTRTKPGKTLEAREVERDAAKKMVDNVSSKVEGKNPPSFPNEMRNNAGKPAEADRAKRETTDKMVDNISSKVEEKTSPSSPKEMRTNAGKTTDGERVPRDKTPQVVSRDKTSTGKMTKPTAEEPQRLPAANVVGEDKKTPQTPSVTSKTTGEDKEATGKEKTRGKAIQIAQVPMVKGSTPEGKRAAGKGKIPSKETVNQFQRPDDVKQDKGKDKTAPSLAQVESWNTGAVTKKVLDHATSPALSSEKAAASSRSVGERARTSEGEEAPATSRKEAHVKVVAMEVARQETARQKRDSEEEENPQEVRKDGVVKQNVTGEGLRAETDDGKVPPPPPAAVRPGQDDAEAPRATDGVEHVHFVAQADHGGPPEASPLTGDHHGGPGEPESMSLKTRRHPEDEAGEGDEVRPADPRRFPPGGGYRPKDTSEAPVLQFPALPDGETFRTPELGLSEGLFLFSYLGDFLSWLQPYDFPVELIRDALWNRVTVTDLITESLQVEAGFIVCLCVGAVLALALPLVAVCHACCNVVRGSSKGGVGGGWEDGGSSTSSSCRRRALLCSLHTVLVLLAVCVCAMFATNEQVSGSVQSAPSVVHTALGDVGAFVRTTHHQLSFVTTKSLEQALSAATEDLDNADDLLGRPIQQEIAHEAGADVALEALTDVLTAVTDVSEKAAALLEQCAETRGLAVVAKERLADLRHQLDVAKRQCVGRDRALCDTLDGSGLDVVLRLDALMSDDQLTALRSLRTGNFSAAAQQAKADFQLIPREVEESTREARLGIRRELVRQRSYVQASLSSLDSVSRDVGVRVDAARNLVLSAMQTVADVEQWRWLVGLGACLTMLLLWLVLTAGAACGCCGSQEKARTTLIVGVCLTSVFSLVLWTLTLVTLVLGGHGEVFICRPLYAAPDYGALSRLLDRPGVLFPRGGGGGFFRNVLGDGGGPNRTLDVPLRQVLQECESDTPAYKALELRQVFDTELATGHGGRWDSVRLQLSRLSVDVASLHVLTPGLHTQLGDVLQASAANVTQHRLALGGAVTARDLDTLADQLLATASQAADLAMASRLETLAARTRRLLATHVVPLQQRKEDLVYRLTSLEVSLAPLQRQTNQSLSHLKAIQYYVTHQGESIAQAAVSHYTSRILSYLQQARAHILNSVVKDVAPCRPLFQVFNAARQLLCRHIVDPLNGLWFASSLSLLLLLIATPLCLKLVDAFRQSREGGLLTSNMSESPSETVDMQGNWNTPGSGEQDGW